MFRKSTLALAAAVSLGAVALTASNAMAFGHSASGGARAGAMHYSGHGVTLNRTVSYNRVVRIPPPILIPRPHPHHHPHWHWHFGWRPYYIAPVAAGVTYSAPTWNRCTCLTKDYTPEGAVVFKDVCTNEMAMNPPETTQGPAAANTQTQQPTQVQ